MSSGPDLSMATASGRTSTNRSGQSHDAILGDPGDPHDLVDPEANETTALIGHNGKPGASNDTVLWAGFEDFAGLSWWKTPSVYWLIGPFFLFTLAFGGSIVPRLNLIIDLICQKHFLDQLRDDPNFCFTPVVIGAENPQCKTPEVQKLVAEFTLILSVVVGLLSAITAPKLGELSDRYGRKGLIIFSSTGGIANEIITILAARFPASVPYQILIVGSIFDGLGGSFTAGSVLSHSYASDCTPPSKRGVAMGYLHACLFSGFALGPLLAGYFVELTGTLVSVFYVTLACHIIFILFIFFITPESLSMKRQLLAREKHDEEQMMLQHSGWYSRLMGGKTNPLAPLRILVPPGREKAPIRRNLVTLAICDFVILGSAMASSSIVLLYSELVFGWTNLETNQFVSFLASIRVFVLMAIFPLITWCFRTRPMQKARAKVLAAEQQSLGGSGSAWNQDESPEHHAAALQPETNSGADSLDIWLLRVSVLSDMLGALGYVLVRTPALFVLSGAVTAFGGIATATIQASATKHVPPQMVGQLLGAIGLLHAIGRIFTPVLFNGLYAATVKTFPQAFFVLLLGCFAFAFVSSWFVRPNIFMPESTQDDEPEANPLVAPRTPVMDILDDEVLPA